MNHHNDTRCKKQTHSCASKAQTEKCVQEMTQQKFVSPIDHQLGFCKTQTRTARHGAQSFLKDKTANFANGTIAVVSSRRMLLQSISPSGVLTNADSKLALHTQIDNS